MSKLQGKFHVTVNGVKDCNAKVNDCPLLKVDPNGHFDDKNKAQAYFDAEAIKEFGLTVSLKGNDRVELQRLFSNYYLSQDEYLENKRLYNKNVVGAADYRRRVAEGDESVDKEMPFYEENDWQEIIQLYKTRMDRAEKELMKAQVALETSGMGHKIRDDEKTLRVSTQEQKWIVEEVLKHEIQKGYWSDMTPSSQNEWLSLKVVVDPRNLGKNFISSKVDFALCSKENMKGLGLRMINSVFKNTEKSKYSVKDLEADLLELEKALMTPRGRV